jgi:ABC-type nitrate/sulfonate/bicarbonate transport system substrate-binding protein
MMDRRISPRSLKFAFGEGIGAALVLFGIAQQQRLFEKYELEIEPVPARGATVPRVNHETPVGLIGEPAAILQAAEGADLRIIASLSSAVLSGHLVARPGIKFADDLRGKRVGVRVLGAGVWISTVLALEQLGLSPGRDDITAVPIGSPIEILRALEETRVDAALVTVVQSFALQERGYTAVLAEYPAGINTYGLCLAAHAGFVATYPDVVRDIMQALVEACALAVTEKNQDLVMRAFGSWLNITDADTASRSLSELNRIPYPSLAALAKMQRIIAMHEPNVMQIHLETLVDDQIVRSLDESGAIARLYDAHGATIRR